MKLVSRILVICVAAGLSSAWDEIRDSPPLEVDTSEQVFRLLGDETYTLLPTTTIKNGFLVYQGYSEETCQPLNRYVYCWYYDDKHKGYLWTLDSDLVEGDRVNRIANIWPFFDSTPIDSSNVFSNPSPGINNWDAAILLAIDPFVCVPYTATEPATTMEPATTTEPARTTKPATTTEPARTTKPATTTEP
eukprot:Lankesteria_metandrocarpae@DN8962_c0_g1_i1.p1